MLGGGTFFHYSEVVKPGNQSVITQNSMNFIKELV